MSVKTKPEWKPITFEHSDLILKAKIRDQEVEVMMSPYDVPEFIRAYAIEDEWHVIEFKYISNEEETVEFGVDSHAFYVVGKSSGRLYSFRFNEKSPLFQGVGSDPGIKWAELDRLIKEIMENQKDTMKRRSYGLVKKAVQKTNIDLATA